MPYIHTMLTNRSISALAIALLVPLALAAQGQPPAKPGAHSVKPPATAPGQPAAKPAEPPTEAEKTIDEAARKVAALASVAADLDQAVDMLDQRFSVKGRYLRAPNHRIYLRLSVSGLADATGTLLQVCDGKTLWDYSQILDGKSYRKVEVGQIFEKLKSPDLEAELRTQIVTQLGFAGPEQLLTGLRNVVRFDQKESGTLDKKEVWVITGEWKGREGLLPPGQQVPAAMPLPAFVPSLVKLYVGKADGWPYKLELVGRRPSVVTETRKVGLDGRLIGAKSMVQEVRPTRVTLVYSNVQLNPELKLDEFVFTAPADAQVVDATENLVTALDQAIQQRVLQKQAEAARNEAPALPQSIDVPRSGAVPSAEPIPPAPGSPAR